MEAAARKTMIAKPDIPETMRAAAIDRFGGPEVISTHTLPVPRPNAQEVLIKLQSAGVGLWDAHMRDGSWVVGKKRFPFILGIDGAGTVAAVGARVKRFAVGDFVYAYSYTNRSGGFYAEYAAVAAGKVAPVPAGFDAIHVGGHAVHVHALATGSSCRSGTKLTSATLTTARSISTRCGL